MLPLARRDIEHLRQILTLQKRLLDVHQPEKARRALAQRGPFREALTWLEIHGNAPEAVESWRAFLEDGDEAPAADSRPDGGDPQRRRRRRRRPNRSSARTPA